MIKDLGRSALAALVVGLVSLSQPALAQQDDNSGSSPWSGFTGGGNFGGAFGGSDFLSAVNSGIPFNDYAAYPNYGNRTLNSKGVTGGGQLGYTFKMGGLVLGFEGDVNAQRIKKTSDVKVPGLVYSGVGCDCFKGGSGTITLHEEVSSHVVSTFRPKIGFEVTPSLLAYATGGVAITRLSLAHSISDTSAYPATESSSSTQTKAGWVMGGGLEFALTRNISFRTEYLFTQFSNVKANGQVNPLPAPSCVGSCPSQTFRNEADLATSTVRTGINFKF